MWVLITLIVLHWYLSLFTQSFFLHRYAAHRMFTMPRWMEKVMFVLTWLTQGASYLSPFAYGAMHRQHHSYTDTERDPHSPKFSKNLFLMMWETREYYKRFLYTPETVPPEFATNLPQWRAFDRFAYSHWSQFSWGALYVLIYVLFAPSAWWFLLLPVHFLMGAFHGALVNWFGHKIGYRNYNVDNTSTNLWPVELLLLGELLHNNHHAKPASANFAQKWYELDIVYQVMRGMQAVGLIKMRKQSA